jgi:methylated-DNA-[protein]-cysteine S-methyltransferase
MFINADRCEVPGWGAFWVGVIDNKVVFLQLPSGNHFPVSASGKQDVDVPIELEQFAKKWGLSLIRRSTGFTKEVWFQVSEYLNGTREKFDLSTQLLGTEFQVRVWQALLTIPWGRVSTYGDIGAILGNRGLARAVGQANGRNPISIIVPCHRVVAKDGLGGYGGGLDMKKRLLHLEGII